MKMLTGYLPITDGRAAVCGYDVVGESLESRKKIGYLPEGAPLYGDMSGLAFLNFVAEIRGFRGSEIKQRVDYAVNRLELQSVINKPIETLSKGFKRRVGLAQAILHDPDVLILDEPTDGLDPNQKHHVRALIKSLATDKIVIISTHLLEEVTAVCSRAVIIANGKIVADGTPSELESQSRFHQAIRVTLTDSHDLVADLATLPGIASVEVEEDNRLAYTIFAEGGASIFSQVSEIAQQKHWPISEFHVERGQLEDVFRSVTQQSEGQTDE